MTLTLETREKQKPIILIYGNNPLVPLLLDEYSKDFKIAYVGDLEQNEKWNDFYRIPVSNAQWVKNLEEKIDYAVIFLSRKEDKNLIPAFLEKISNDETRTAIVIDIESLDSFYDVLLEYKNIETLKFLFLGDVYSENPYFDSKSRLPKIIHRTLSSRSITISEELESVFPIYYKDAILGINQTLFGPKKKDIFYYLFYSEPQTLNALAYILRQIEPDLEMYYKESEEKLPVKSHGQLTQELKSKILVEPIFLDKYFIGFEKSLNFFENVSPIKNGTKEEIKDKIIEISKTVPHKFHFKSVVVSLIVASVLFVILNISMIGLGLFQLKTSARLLRDGEYKKASSIIKSAASLLKVSEPFAQLGAKVAGKNFDQIQESVDLMLIASNNLDSLGKVTKSLDRETLEETISEGIYFYFRFQQLKSEAKWGPQAPGSPNSKEFGVKELGVEKWGPQNLFWGEKNEDLSNVLSISQVLPIILGYDEEKNYLLLFQNNGELRPTGGFIGSVGELKLKGGKAEITIQDVYEYDGKLKAHIEPHYILRRYLQPHLYLRDSNFDPDFQISASTSALLYDLETERKVDGVIGINFEAVRRLLEEIGPVELPAYKKTLDGKNSFDFLQTTIDDNFFPGSTQKKDVLTALFNQLVLKLEDQDAFIRAARLLPKLMNEKHVIFAFNSGSMQSIFTNLGYGGTLDDNRNIEEERLNDFLAINEANIGVNKANINITRETEYKINLGNKITSNLSHILKNEGGKEYNAYLRIFAPLGSKLTSISFDEEKQAIVPAITDFKAYERPNFKPPQGLEVDQEIIQRFQVFGFILSVAPYSTKKIEITYDNGIALPSDTIVTYSLYLIKQPGTEKYPFALNLSYGEKLAPKEVENAILSEDSIIIKRELSRDGVFDARLIKR